MARDGPAWSWVFVQKCCEIETARGMTVVRQDRRGFAAVICPVVDDVHQAMPQHPFTKSLW